MIRLILNLFARVATPRHEYPTCYHANSDMEVAAARRQLAAVAR